MNKDNKIEDLTDLEMVLQMWDEVKTDDDVYIFISNTIWKEFRKQFKYIYRTEKDEWIDDKYQYVDDNYIRLYYNKNDKRICGDLRYTKLKKRVYLRRIIKNDITKEEMVMNVITDIIHGFSFSDGGLTSKEIMKIINEVFDMSIFEIEVRYDKEIKKIIDESRTKTGIIYKNKECYNKRGEGKRKLLDEYYRKDLSIQTNIELIEIMTGVSMSYNFVDNYLKERGIEKVKNKTRKKRVKEYNDIEIMYMIDITISERKNINKLKDKCSERRIRVLYNQKKNKGDNMDGSIVCETEIPYGKIKVIVD